MFLCPNVSKHIITSSLKVKMQRLPFKHCRANTIRKSSLHPFTSYQHLSTFIFLFVCRSEQCVHFTFSTFSACMDTDLHIHSLHLRNLTFFSFFSELHHSNQVATTIMETAAISAVFLVSVAANAGAAVLVTCGRRLLANNTILTLNLFVADLLFVSMIPLIVTVRWTVSWELGYAACHTLLYVICMSGCVTITTLATISVERVQAILRLQTVPSLAPRMVTVTLVFIWAFSALTSFPLSLFFTVMEVDFPKLVWMNLKKRKYFYNKAMPMFVIISAGTRSHLYSQVA